MSPTSAAGGFGMFTGVPDEKRILIVDDDRDLHPLLVAALAAPGRAIDSAYHGMEGLGSVGDDGGQHSRERDRAEA
jgi:hypothetical protein